MSDEEPLLNVAAALADGTVVDWDSAAQSLTSDEDRRLLRELQFVEGLTRAAHAEPTAIAAGEFWGPLKILEHVGRGAFGDVYRAWDSRLDREVALKILRGDDASNQTHASTVIREGQLLARVRHPNVATVYGAERIGDQIGVWMEFVHGKTLEQTLRDHGLFAVDRATRVGIELSGALTAIHQAGLIHRDVKTQNVLCDGGGRLVLTDFGAGCDVHETTAAAGRDLAGTPIFVAPELLEGRTATAQADVYSLGVLLYHLVTGDYPVSGRSLREIREAHARGRRTPLATARPDLSRAFVRVIDRAIDPDVTNRYESPEAFGAALASLEHAKPRRGWLVALAAVLFAGAVLWAAGAVPRSRVSGSDSTVSRNPEIVLTEIITLADQGRFEDAYELAVRLRSDAPASPFGANGAAYSLTYAGYLVEATRAFDDVLRISPDYIEENAWWTPTALLYQRDIDRFLSVLRRVDLPSARLYRAIAELERGRRDDALSHLIDIEQNATDPFKFNGLALALRASLTDRQQDVPAMIRSIADERRVAGGRDGEVTFKQAQILAVAGHLPAALAVLEEAVAEGFVCVACFEASSLLEPVRALPDYRRVRERALARHLRFGQRFGLQDRRSER